MIRHSVQFVWNDRASDEAKLKVKEGLSYVSFFSTILDLDYGESLGLSPESNSGLYLSHDHYDKAMWDAYNDDPHHKRVGQLIKSLTESTQVARVDWEYAGPASTRGSVRHSALYRWREGMSQTDQARALRLAGSLRSMNEVNWLGIGADLGWYKPNHDWALEVHFSDRASCSRFLEREEYRETMETLQDVLDVSATSVIQHTMKSG